jgi:hypothetical protein
MAKRVANSHLVVSLLTTENLVNKGQVTFSLECVPIFGGHFGATTFSHFDAIHH